MTFRKLVLGTALVAGLAFGGAQPAFAQEVSESHLAAARSALSAIRATDRYDDILPGLALNLKGQLIANNPDLEAQINEVVDDETIALVSRRVDLENEAARVYAKALSEEHLLAIAEFYRTDAGIALLDNGAIMAREVEQASAVWSRGIQRDLSENVNAKLREVAPRLDENQVDTTTEAQ